MCKFLDGSSCYFEPSENTYQDPKSSHVDPDLEDEILPESPKVPFSPPRGISLPAKPKSIEKNEELYEMIDNYDLLKKPDLHVYDKLTLL